jgi:hypothetical protein
MAREESRLAAVINAGIPLPLTLAVELQGAIQAGGEPLEQIRSEVREGAARTIFTECWHRDAIATKNRRLHARGPANQTIADLIKNIRTPLYAFEAADHMVKRVEEINEMPIEAIYLLLADPGLRHEYPPRPWLLGHYLVFESVGSGGIRWKNYNQMPPGFVLRVPSIPLPWAP